MIKAVLLVGIGGGIGSILRFLVSEGTNKLFHTTFPLGTFIVNVTGCFIIGLLFGLFASHISLNANLKLLLITGFCGGFTTFSTFSHESLVHFQTGHTMIAIGYIVSSILTGLFAVWGGFELTK